MMQSIIAGILGLVVGFGAGLWGGNSTTQSPQQSQDRTQERLQDEAGTLDRQRTQLQDQTQQLQANDFVSVRPAVAGLASEDLSQAEINGLVYMREEEKLARDVYTTLYETWGLPIFSNIAQSEQTHTEAVRVLLDKYNLTDPVSDDSVGVFTNTDLQALYTDLVARGQASEVEALTVGSLIEELDIKDIQEQIDLADNADITLVYGNLLRGSRNHLRAFAGQLESRGVTYEPQYIPAVTLADILNTGVETGSSKAERGWGGTGRQGGGQGQGQGGGRQ